MNGSCCQWEGLPDKSCSISLWLGPCQGWLSTKTLHSSQWPALRLLGSQSSTLKTRPRFIMYSVCTIQRGRKLGEDRGLCSDSPIFTLISCFLNIICWKQYPFSTGLPLPFSQRSVGCIYVDLFMVSFSQSIGFSTLLPAPCCEDSCMIICALQVRYCGVPNFVPFSISLVILDLNLSK